MIVDHAHLIRLRLAEVERVHEWFKPNAKVLEIGGGNGFQASVLSSWGCDVVSIDVAEKAMVQDGYHPVQTYDGKKIPIPDASIDLIFSSNVLEHIKPISEILRETRRVLKSHGLAVHVVPSPAWRLWTSLAHYPFLLKCASSLLQPGSASGNQTILVSDAVRKRGFAFAVKRALSSGPHGEYPNALSELYFFSKIRWKRLFEDAGFEPLEITTNGIFYTGYGLFPNLSIGTRQCLARILGSACHIFVLKKN